VFTIAARHIASPVAAAMVSSELSFGFLCVFASKVLNYFLDRHMKFVIAQMQQSETLRRKGAKTQRTAEAKMYVVTIAARHFACPVAAAMVWSELSFDFLCAFASLRRRS
jgi:type III secretory pathway component EscT